MKHMIPGLCPVCRLPTVYRSRGDWLRDQLRCPHCKSIPRERAFAVCLDQYVPDWRKLRVHESSPLKRSISAVLAKECGDYIGSQYYPEVGWGVMHEGYRSENLEALTFEDESIDLHCHLDVLEHVNHPDLCFQEMYRTLRPGGKILCTTPIYKGRVKTERRALFEVDGSVTHLVKKPEYHGNPVSKDGSLVTFHYGADLPELIMGWIPGASVTIINMLDREAGVLGEFREVIYVVKPHNAAPFAGAVDAAEKLVDAN